MFRNIVIINGSARTGKDSFIDFFCGKINIPTYNISSIKEAEIVLFNLQYVLGISNEISKKTDIYRAMLHDVKCLLVKYGDRPFKQIVSKIKNIDYASSKSVIFIHCREGEEIAKLVEYFGKRCITLLLKRNIAVPDNPADKNVDKYFGYDIVIEDFDLNKMDVYAEKLKGFIYGQN